MSAYLDLTSNPAFVKGEKEWVYDESNDPEWLVGKTLSVNYGKSFSSSKWRVGTIKSFNKRTGKHQILYDDYNGYNRYNSYDRYDDSKKDSRFRTLTWSVVGLPGHHLAEDPCPDYVLPSSQFPNIAGSLDAARKQVPNAKLLPHHAEVEALIGDKVSCAAAMLGNEIMESIKKMAKKVDQKLEQIRSEKKQLCELLHRAGIDNEEGLESKRLVTVHCRGTSVRSARDLFYHSELCEVAIKSAEKNEASLHTLLMHVYKHGQT